MRPASPCTAWPATQARDPAFYAQASAPDTVEGRFELYMMHVILLAMRLRGQGAQAAETSQVMFDAFLRGLDDAMREMGVGDLSVGKKMRKLGEAFYGRAKAYAAAVADARRSSRRSCARTLYADREDAEDAGPTPRAWPATSRGRTVTWRRQPLDRLLDGEARFPEFAA